MKWSFVPHDTGKPTYVVVNFDESEPGTCNNRELVERDPHRLLEGTAIAALAIGCRTAFIYVRGEYLCAGPSSSERRSPRPTTAGFLGTGIAGSDVDLDIVLHRGAGAYICGEETALLNSLEGLRGQPRLRPPFPAVEGLYACPTVINNVETLMNVPDIVLRGPEWFRELGHREVARARSCSRSAARSSVRATTSSRSARRSGCSSRTSPAGVLGGRSLKAWTPGGSSTPLLTAEHIDTRWTTSRWPRPARCSGTGAIMVLDDTDCVVDAAQRMTRFYAHESCGKCTPCREGTWWAERVLERIADGYGRRGGPAGDAATWGRHIMFRAFCALADGAAAVIDSSLKHFSEEFEEHVRLGRCPLRVEHEEVAGLTPDTDVTLTIDGKEVTVPAGTLIIRAAEQLGIEIPRFCDHPLLEPAGACRQCYVQIEGQPKLATSCTVPVAAGHVGEDAGRATTRSPTPSARTSSSCC